MNKELDSEAMIEVLKALDQMKKDAENRRKKQIAKLWAPIQLPLTLKEALSKLTRDQLDQIRKHLDIKNISSLKKADLIGALQEHIEERAPEMFQCFDRTRCQLLIKAVKNGGWVTASGLDIEQVERLRDQALFFSGIYNEQQVIVMPEELVKAYKQLEISDFNRIVQRNTEWIKLTCGLLYYYGTLTLYALKNMVEKYSGENVDFLLYMRVIQDAMNYYGEIRAEGDRYSNCRVFDAGQVIAEHQARPEINYYPFSPKQLLIAGEPGFVDRNDFYKVFVTFIADNYQIPVEEADLLVEECVYATRIGEKPTDLLQFLQSQLEMEDLETVRAFMQHITLLMNNTRQWELKGYTPNELRKQVKQDKKPLAAKRADIIDITRRKDVPASLRGQVPINKTGGGFDSPASLERFVETGPQFLPVLEKNRQKIGRNDPCPCGSGKKYKKCCGR